VAGCCRSRSDWNAEPQVSARATADALRLKQILYHLRILYRLHGNAVKFNPADGCAWVDARVGANFVEVSVGDTGVGIDAKEPGKIFKTFYQAGTGTGGTGLGLAITKHLVKLHGRRIRVESYSGKGVCFIFRCRKLPRRCEHRIPDTSAEISLGNGRQKCLAKVPAPRQVASPAISSQIR
jgi:signal transduction histidine kinase